MVEFVLSGGAVLVILGLIGLEAVGIALYRRLTGRGPRLQDLAFTLLSGGFLILALHAALTGAPPFWLMGWLSGALIAHIADLRSRW